MRASQVRKKDLVAILGALVRAITAGKRVRRFRGIDQSGVHIPVEVLKEAMNRDFQTLIECDSVTIEAEHPLYCSTPEIRVAVTKPGVAVRRRKR